MVVDAVRKHYRYDDALEGRRLLPRTATDSGGLAVDICRHVSPMQPCKARSLECGLCISWWMEVSAEGLGEGKLSKRWPHPLETRREMEKLLNNLQPAAKRTQKHFTVSRSPP